MNLEKSVLHHSEQLPNGQKSNMSLEQFMHNTPKQKTKIEFQTWLRIKLSIAAYAYEFKNSAIMSDAEFDKKCLQVDTSIKTTNKKLDTFFKKEFNASTGQWIHKHPELEKIKKLYETYY